MEAVRMWVIEDNAADALLVDVALKRAGFPVELTRVNDGAEAIVMIEEVRRHVRAAPQVVLLDLNLPKVGGVEVLRALRACAGFSATRVGVFIAAATGNDRQEVDELDVDCHLDKPSDLDGFSSQIVLAVKKLAAAASARPVPVRRQPLSP